MLGTAFVAPGIHKPATAAFFAKKSGPGDVFGFIAAKKAEHSVKTMCRVLEVSRSGFTPGSTRAVGSRA